jgi:hypothetical protein
MINTFLIPYPNFIEFHTNSIDMNGQMFDYFLKMAKDESGIAKKYGSMKP